MSVNGELVELKSLSAAPGCYVLGVKFAESFVNVQPGRGTRVALFFGPFVTMAAFMAETKQSNHESDQVPFALDVRKGHSYWITATFTGDEFLPRIVESDANGERLGQIDPAKSTQELHDCEARKPILK